MTLSRSASIALGASLLGLAAALGQRKPAPVTPPLEPVGPPPPPADLPVRPGGIKVPNPVTGEMVAAAQSINKTHPPLGVVTELTFGDDGKTYIAFATYHLEGDRWVRAVEIWERV